MKGKSRVRIFKVQDLLWVGLGRVRIIVLRVF